MKAPDKIYLPVLASSLLNREVLENHWIEVQSPFAKENIAYIRKDTLLEIIKEESKFWDDGEMIFRALIEKINSM